MERLLLGRVVPTLAAIIGHDEERIRHVSGGMVRIFAAKEFVAVLVYSGRFSKDSLTDRCANRNVSKVESKTIMLEHSSKTCSLVN
jgi:hypothetical protein